MGDWNKNGLDDSDGPQVAKQFIGLILIGIGSKFLGFAREFFIANKLGTSLESDAYFLAIAITVTFCGGFLAIFSTSFIPVYSQLVLVSQDESNGFINKLQTLIFVLLMAISLLFFLFKTTLLSTVFPNADSAMLALTDRLASIMFFYVVASSVRSVLGGYLQYHNQTATVYFIINIVQNIVILASIVLYAGNPDVLGYGYALAGLTIAGCLLWVASKHGFRYAIDFRFRSPHIHTVLILTLPIFLNHFLADINTFFDKSIATGLGVGIVSSLNYAYKINDIFVLTFATTLATALYPEISKLIARNEQFAASRLLGKSLRQITLLLIPFATSMLFFSQEIVELILMRGAFDVNSAVVTAHCLQCYCIGMLFFAFRQVLYRALLSCKKTKTILFNSIWTVGINITLNVLLSRMFGYRGVALATTISMGVMTTLMLVDISKSDIPIPLIGVIRENFPYLAVAFLAMGAARVGQIASARLFPDIFQYRYAALFWILVALVSYIGIHYARHDEALGELTRMATRKLRRRA